MDAINKKKQYFSLTQFLFKFGKYAISKYTIRFVKNMLSIYIYISLSLNVLCLIKIYIQLNYKIF